MQKLIKSPLRYPGGKSKAIPEIIKHLPHNFIEYREPFVGGGSLFIYLKQKFPHLKIWINDLNYDLYCFWFCCQNNLKELIVQVQKIKNSNALGRDIYNDLINQANFSLSLLDRAVRFFVLNRITFSGTVECGGYSQKAFEGRFTQSSIDRLYLLEQIMPNIKITNCDYKDLLNKESQKAFLYLDPPYLSTTNSKLYGKKGDLHTWFNHVQFSEHMKQCNHDWLITYDDLPTIRELFYFANIFEYQLQYGMNNYKQEHAKKGNELIIKNYN